MTVEVVSRYSAPAHGRGTFVTAELRRYPGDLRIEAHAHAVPLLCLPLRGGYRETIRGRSASHGRGEMLFCPSGEPHRQHIGSGGALKLLIEPGAEMLAYLEAHCALGDAPEIRDARARTLAARLADEMAQADDVSPMLIEGYVLELIGMFARTQRRSRSDPAPRWLEGVRDAIAADVELPLAPETLARAAGRHPVTMMRAFRRAYGCSPGEYQRRLRVERAMALIDRGLPLAEVALRCGFCDQSHLTRVFRATLGRTPGDYRRC